MSKTSQTTALLGTRIVPFGDGAVKVREMGLRQRKAFLAFAKEHEKEEAILWLCANTCIEGELVGLSMDDIDATYTSEALAKVSVDSLRLSGLADEKKDGDAGNA